MVKPWHISRFYPHAAVINSKLSHGSWVVKPWVEWAYKSRGINSFSDHRLQSLITVNSGKSLEQQNALTKALRQDKGVVVVVVVVVETNSYYKQFISIDWSKKRESKTAGRPLQSDYRVKHGSSLYPAESKGKGQYCRLQGNANTTNCPFISVLCQTLHRDCHKMWHLPSFDQKWAQWFAGQTRASSQLSVPKPLKRGRPKGSVNRRWRHGAYRSK